MAHIRKPLGAAVALNTAIFVIEAVAGVRANSVSLVMDAVHNCSDELALVCLWLAYWVTARMSRKLQRSANLFNSLGLILVSGVILWQAAERLLHPRPMIGWLPVAIGLAAAVGNWGVAAVLKPWQQHNAAIRLAYLHNLGDVYVSLLPALAGVLVTITGASIFDPLLAAGIAVWLIASTVQEIKQSGDALLWPQDARCPHEDRAATARASQIA
jgi:cobalt-zinc-cadmium efflux system protein